MWFYLSIIFVMILLQLYQSFSLVLLVVIKNSAYFCIDITSDSESSILIPVKFIHQKIGADIKGYWILLLKFKD